MVDRDFFCGYVDTYSKKVYTNLEEGTILIKRGSSYYDTNGNKVDLGTANTGSTSKEEYVAQVVDNNSIVTDFYKLFKKLSMVYNLSASQMMELIEYYESLGTSVEDKLRKYQLTLIKVLNMYLNLY